MEILNIHYQAVIMVGLHNLPFSQVAFEKANAYGKNRYKKQLRLHHGEIQNTNVVEHKPKPTGKLLWTSNGRIGGLPFRPILGLLQNPPLILVGVSVVDPEM